MADKLLKLLGDIYTIKGRMKSVLGTDSDDICEYPTLIHNYFVDAYNTYYPDGYLEGYNDAWIQILGVEPLVPPTTPQQRTPQQYTPNIPVVTEYRDQRLADQLGVIMEEVRIARLGMKEELGTDSDMFVTYPDLLSYKIEHVEDIEDEGYDDGWDDAELAIAGITLNPPTISRADDIITITSEYSSATIKYNINNGTTQTYYGPFTIDIPIGQSETLYAWVVAGSQDQYESDKSSLVIQSDYSTMPFTIKKTDNTGSYIHLRIPCQQNNTDIVGYMRYKLGDGQGHYSDWSAWSSSSASIVQYNFGGSETYYYYQLGMYAEPYTIVQFKVDNPNPIIYNTGHAKYDTYSLDFGNIEASNYWTTNRNDIFGNIMSLLNSSDYSNMTQFNTLNIPDGIFKYFLSYCPTDNAEHLILPRNTVPYCYEHLFAADRYLVTIPEIVSPTLTEGCYAWMFYNCIILNTTPSLPVTTLAERCYEGMFAGCSSLTTAPALPATTLIDYCYIQMFAGCSSLTTAPVLPADRVKVITTSWPGGGIYEIITPYDEMFHACTSLNYIKCLAENGIDQNNNLIGNFYNFFGNVTSSYPVVSNGTFVKKNNTNTVNYQDIIDGGQSPVQYVVNNNYIWIVGESSTSGAKWYDIPSTWTIVDAT